MRINLKEPEIINALKLFLQTQGIQIGQKNVEVLFTAGRGKTGLSADISIEDLPVDIQYALEKAASTATTGAGDNVPTPSDEPLGAQEPEKAVSLFG